MKILINPRYEHLRPFVERLTRPIFFTRHGETLHSGRNTVKLFETDGMRLVVKSYERLSLFNRFAYGLLRKSKAMRAYRHAGQLRRLGIDTPEEVAVVEIRKGGAMRHCYFVSLYTDCESIRPTTELFMQREEAKRVLDGVAELLVRMHWAGVEHKDLNVGNILYRKEKDRYCFQVIDTNRMSFHKYMSMRRKSAPPVVRNPGLSLHPEAVCRNPAGRCSDRSARRGCPPSVVRKTAAHERKSQEPAPPQAGHGRIRFRS